ncbi:MAG: hypothetical protein PVG55_00920 [Nitrospirota bacterium]|jgi:hypothetical protein
MEKRRPINCWEYKQCGMEVARQCPAYPGAGRICYMVAGTLCGGGPLLNYDQKAKNCMQCDFYLSEILDAGDQQGAAGSA